MPILLKLKNKIENKNNQEKNPKVTCEWVFIKTRINIKYYKNKFYKFETLINQILVKILFWTS